MNTVDFRYLPLKKQKFLGAICVPFLYFLFAYLLSAIDNKDNKEKIC